MLKFVDELDRLQKKTELWRGWLFLPFLRACRAIGLTADGVATLRLFLAGLFPLLIISHPGLAWLAISLSIFLDCFDGTLARFMKVASDRGKFTDVLTDQVTFAFLALGALRLWPELSLALSSAAAAIIFLYAIAMVHRNEHKPSNWLFEARAQLTSYKIAYIILIVLLASDALNIQTVLTYLWLLTALATLHFLLHYFQFILKK